MGKRLRRFMHTAKKILAPAAMAAFFAFASPKTEAIADARPEVQQQTRYSAGADVHANSAGIGVAGRAAIKKQTAKAALIGGVFDFFSYDIPPGYFVGFNGSYSSSFGAFLFSTESTIAFLNSDFPKAYGSLNLGMAADLFRIGNSRARVAMALTPTMAGPVAPEIEFPVSAGASYSYRPAPRVLLSVYAHADFYFNKNKTSMAVPAYDYIVPRFTGYGFGIAASSDIADFLASFNADGFYYEAETMLSVSRSISSFVFSPFIHTNYRRPAADFIPQSAYELQLLAGLRVSFASSSFSAAASAEYAPSYAPESGGFRAHAPVFSQGDITIPADGAIKEVEANAMQSESIAELASKAKDDPLQYAAAFGRYLFYNVTGVSSYADGGLDISEFEGSADELFRLVRDGKRPEAYCSMITEAALQMLAALGIPAANILIPSNLPTGHFLTLAPYHGKLYMIDASDGGNIYLFSAAPRSIDTLVSAVAFHRFKVLVHGIDMWSPDGYVGHLETNTGRLLKKTVIGFTHRDKIQGLLVD